MAHFIGREPELTKLLSLSRKKTASFVVVRGRRRIGKSRLVEEFGKNFDLFCSFEGLSPELGVTKADQLNEFSIQLSQQLTSPRAQYYDWSDAFLALGERISDGKILILFDEISWMGMDDPTFLGKVKIFWDKLLKKNDQLMFIICGSASAWIEKNILSSTGFVGRISYTLTLEELPISTCKNFWNNRISAYEKLKILAITGGIPKYLEEIDPKLSAEENIKQLCFTKGAILVEEFKQIFSDLFLKNSSLYKKIIQALISSPKDRASIAKHLSIDPGGRISEYLWELELSGFIKREHTWNIATSSDSKLSRYRLRDNYLRFHLKYIEPNISKINRDLFQFKSLSSLPEWHTILGLQFENLVLNNKKSIHKALELPADQILNENPFFQKNTQRYPGCQIDYMIQTKFGSLYICEIKFSKNAVNSSVILEVEKKIKALKYPKGYSCRPVLIHVNGVTEELIAADFFAAIIDVSIWLVN